METPLRFDHFALRVADAAHARDLTGRGGDPVTVLVSVAGVLILGAVALGIAHRAAIRNRAAA